MSRRLPLCAHCGLPLRGSGKTILEYGSLPGNPTIGWHWAESGKCLDGDDAMWKRLRDKGGTPVETLLAEIAARGPGRVVRNKVR